MDGSLYVYMNRKATQMRVLYFDRSGYCVWGKRLEAGKFLRNWCAVRTREMNWTELKLLIEGIEIGRRRKRLDLRPSAQNILDQNAPGDPIIR
jgi:transposase